MRSSGPLPQVTFWISGIPLCEVRLYVSLTLNIRLVSCCVVLPGGESWAHLKVICQRTWTTLRWLKPTLRYLKVASLNHVGYRELDLAQGRGVRQTVYSLRRTSNCLFGTSRDLLTHFINFMTQYYMDILTQQLRAIWLSNSFFWIAWFEPSCVHSFNVTFSYICFFCAFIVWRYGILQGHRPGEYKLYWNNKITPNDFTSPQQLSRDVPKRQVDVPADCLRGQARACERLRPF
jgi:hypothetical protein